MKQAVAPLQPLDDRWNWITSVTSADVLVLTEAKVPEGGAPDDWQVVHVPDGIGKRRRWGTVVAGRRLEIQRSEFRRRLTRHENDQPNPATTFTVDILRGGTLMFRLIGAYGLLEGTGNGFRELEFILNECEDVIDHFGPEQLVLAGDLNLWPDDALPPLLDLGLIDVVSRKTRLPELDAPLGGSRIWTHKNGPRDSNGARQEIDFIFVSGDLIESVKDVDGGVDDFPDAWDFSDHAPVVATLDGL
jgi:hypothetical protein